MSRVSEKRSVVIVGGGIAGLAAAHKLRELKGDQLKVILIDSGKEPGGVINTRKIDDCLLDTGPDAFITLKPEALNLCKRIGFSENLVNTNPEKRHTLIVKDKTLYPVPDGFMMLAPTKMWPFAVSPLFSPLGKLRMAMEYFLPPLAPAHEETLSEFIIRRLGKEALDRIAQPMIGGIYAGDPEKLSLKAIMPRFLEMESISGSIIKAFLKSKTKGTTGDSGARYSLFTTPERGMKSFVDAIVKRLDKISILKNTVVTKIDPVNNQNSYRITMENNKTINADGLIIATPARVASSLLSKIDKNLSSLTESINYSSSAVLNLIFKSKDINDNLDGFGFVVPARERLSLMACTFTSVKFPNRTPSDLVSLRAFIGGALNPQILENDDQSIVNMVLSDLHRLLRFNGKPINWVLTRHQQAMPQYEIGHLEKVNEIEQRLASLKNVFLCGNSYTGIGIPDCIKSGEHAAENTAAYFDNLTESNSVKEIKALA